MGSSGQQYCLRWNNHRSNLLTVFDELLQNESFTDVTLACDDGGRAIKCHKMVLAACSSYFQNLFMELPYRHHVVVLKDVKYGEIKAILEYMYRGEVNVAQDQLAALLKVAEQLKVKGLVEENRGGSHPQLHPPHKDDPGQHSPPTISTSTSNIQSAAHSSSSGSPPHSTAINGPYAKSPYSLYRKSPSIDRSWWAVPGLPLTHPPPSVPPPAHPSPAATAAMFANCYDSGTTDLSPLHKRKKTSASSSSSFLMGRGDTPILRTVLGQGQADSSQLISHADSHESLHSNGSAQETYKHLKNEPSEDAQSPYTDLTAMEEEDKSKLAIPSSSPQSFTADNRGITSGIAMYVPTQKPEWKRYKQYTRNDILSAIEAVREGMSALQAARKYGVPSRTLYDKVKKLGITTSRPFKRGTNGSNSCFSYNLSGGSSYGSHVEGENSSMMNHSSAILEASFMHHTLNRDVGEEEMGGHTAVSGEMNSPGNHGLPRSPSPSPSLIKYMHQSMTPSPAPGSDHHHSETNGSSERERDDDEDQVEDLSVPRKPEQQSRVIMPPMNQVSTIMKKDESLKESLRDEGRREVSVDETE